MLKKIMSGGQTGVDRAALDAGLSCFIPIGGWCPKGREAEDGVIDIRYPLSETPSKIVNMRTEWNVRDADATLVITSKEPTGGTALTLEMIKKHNKLNYVVDIEKNPSFKDVKAWIKSNRIQYLNVAGPRESKAPGIYLKAKAFLMKIFR